MVLYPKYTTNKEESKYLESDFFLVEKIMIYHCSSFLKLLTHTKFKLMSYESMVE